MLSSLPPFIAFFIVLIICCLIAGVVLYVTRTLLKAFKTQEPFASIAYCLVILMLLVIALSETGIVGAPHAWRSFGK